MRNASNFKGFDFAVIWTMDGNAAYPYPELVNNNHEGNVPAFPTPTDAPATPVPTSAPTSVPVEPTPSVPGTGTVDTVFLGAILSGLGAAVLIVHRKSKNHC